MTFLVKSCYPLQEQDFLFGMCMSRERKRERVKVFTEFRIRKQASASARTGVRILGERWWCFSHRIRTGVGGGW